MTDRFHLRSGEARGSGAEVDLLVTPESAHWGFSGLAVVSLAPGGSLTWTTGESESWSEVTLSAPPSSTSHAQPLEKWPTASAWSL